MDDQNTIWCLRTTRYNGRFGERSYMGSTYMGGTSQGGEPWGASWGSPWGTSQGAAWGTPRETPQVTAYVPRDLPQNPGILREFPEDPRGSRRVPRAPGISPGVPRLGPRRSPRVTRGSLLPPKESMGVPAVSQESSRVTPGYPGVGSPSPGDPSGNLGTHPR